MLVPIFVLVMGFSPKHAIPLSNVTVFGGSVANFFLNRPKRHPQANRPLMDYDLILVMQPMTIAGALLGSFANKLLPELVLTVCLVALLAYTTRETLTKGLEVYAKETKDMSRKAASAAAATTTALLLGGSGEEEEEEEEEEGNERDGLLCADKKSDKGAAAAANGVATARSSSPSPSSRGSGHGGSSPSKHGGSGSVAGGGGMANYVAEHELSEIYAQESVVPWWKVGTLWAVFSVVILVSLLKGGGGLASPVGLTCGSTGYWLVSALMFAWILAVSSYVRDYLVRATGRKKRLNYKYLSGDIAWDERATVVYPAVCVGAGLCAGMFGIGGGIVQVPLMLRMGVDPKVASATSATMIMYTSFTALTSFYVFGLLLEDYACVGFLVGLVVTAVGQVGITALIKKLGRDSIIIFSVAAVVGVSAVLMGTHSTMQMASSSVDLSIGHVCEAGEAGDK